MTNQSSAIVQRLWNYCTVLRDDGLLYGDYVEQLTYLLFLKMDDERRRIGDPSNLPGVVSPGVGDVDWTVLGALKVGDKAYPV